MNKMQLPVVKSFRAPVNAALFALAGLLVNAPAMAEDSPPPAAAQAAAPSPERLALARQMLDLLDVKSMFRGMLSSLDALVQTVPQEGKPRVKQLLESMTAAFDALTPELLDRTSAIYAQNLTDQEMRDTLVFYRSPSGQTLLKKVPILMGQVFAALNAGGQYDTSSTDPARLALAREVLVATDAEAEIQGSLDAGELSMEEQNQLKEMMPKLLDMTAALYAKNLTEQEMKDTLAFYRTPSGQAIQKKMPEMNKQTMPITKSLLEKMTETAEKDYCAKRTCDEQDRGMFAAMKGAN